MKTYGKHLDIDIENDKDLDEKKKRLNRFQEVKSNKSSFNNSEEQVNKNSQNKTEKEIIDEIGEQNDESFWKEPLDFKDIMVSEADFNKNENKKTRINLNKESQFILNFQDIKIDNLLSENINCFVIFNIGNNISLNNNKNDKNPEYGKCFISELEQNIEKNNSRKVKLNIKETMKFSHLDMKNKYLIIQVWLYSNWTINTLFGEKYIKLIDLAEGNVSRDEFLKGYKDNEKKVTCRVSFRAYFQEYWDYKIRFLDLKINNIRNKNGEICNPSLKIEITNGNFGYKSVSTKILNKTTDCKWEKINSEIRFSGALYELEEQDLIIKIYDNQSFSSDLIVDTLISLKGLINSKILQIPIRLLGKLPNTENNDKENKIKTKHISDKAFATDSFVSYLEGKIKLENEPTYKQDGELFIWKSDSCYIGLNIGRVDSLSVPENIAIVNTYITCQWGNQSINTRIIYDNYNPTFNEDIYFKLPLLNSKVKDKNFYHELKRLLMSRPEIKIMLWLKTENGSNEYLGYCSILISDLVGSDKKEIEFYDSKLKQNKTYNVRFRDLKKKIISNIAANNTYINLNFYLLPDYDTTKIDLSDCFSNENMKINPIIYQQIKNDFKCQIYEGWIYFIKELFEKPEKLRLDNYEKIFTSDQSGYKRFLPTFVEPIQINYDKPLHIKYKYSHLRTALEIFHFINCIEFSISEKNMLFSPDFVLIQNKGTIGDHAIIFCCLLMGCKYENLVDISTWNKTIKSLPTNDKYYEELWLSFEYRTFVCVGIHKNLNKPTYWVMTISRDLETITFWDIEDGLVYNLKGRVASNRFHILKYFLMNKLEDNLEELNKKTDNKVIKENDIKINFNRESYLNNKDIEKPIQLEENDEITIDDKNLKYKMTRRTELANKKDKIISYNYIEQKKIDDKEKLKNKKIKNQIANHDFYDSKNNKVDEAIWPFKTIELIFNNKNCWANLQNSDPTKIFYDLSNPDYWYPFLFNSNEKEVRKAQMINVGTFYHLKNLGRPIDVDNINELEKIIEKNIIFTISCARSGLQCETNIKNNNESLKSLFKQYLDYLEILEGGQDTTQNISRLIESWIEKFKTKIPANFHCSYLPLRFNINDTERIRLIIAENFKEFYTKIKKLCIFNIVCKVYPLPNNINSIRILISYFYQGANLLNEEEEFYENDEYENIDWEEEDSLGES